MKMFIVISNNSSKVNCVGIDQFVKTLTQKWSTEEKPSVSWRVCQHNLDLFEAISSAKGINQTAVPKEP